jgi:hypothetical protein
MLRRRRPCLNNRLLNCANHNQLDHDDDTLRASHFFDDDHHANASPLSSGIVSERDNMSWFLAFAFILAMLDLLVK